MDSLEEHMRRFCDMVFVCGEEEQEVPALRMLVASRSPTLESMLLTSGMAETKLSRVPLPKMEASTMRICMEFFYTDTIQDCSWGLVSTSMKVISAARFFLIPKLEQLVISRCLPRELQHDDASLVDIAKAYTCGVELQDGHPNMRPLMQRLSYCIVFDAHLCLKCYKHLSEQAFIHLIQDLDSSRITIREYCIFHLVIQWCSSQLVFLQCDPSINEQMVQNTIKQTLPWAADDVYKRASMTTDDDTEVVDPSMLKVMKLLSEPVASCLKKLNVKLFNIPARILSKIIEPLEVVPNSMLFAAYKHQALSIPMR